MTFEYLSVGQSSQNCFSMNNAWTSICSDVNFKVTSQFSVCEDNLNLFLYQCVPLCHEWAIHIGGNVIDTFFFFPMLHFNRSVSDLQIFCPERHWYLLCVRKLRSNNQRENAKLEAHRKDHCFLGQDS